MADDRTFLPGDRLVGTGTVVRVLGGEWHPRRVLRMGQKMGLSRRPCPSANWEHALPAFKMVAACDLDALAKFRAGDRKSESVRPYLGTLLTRG